MTIKTPMEESKRSEGKTFRIERFFVARQPIGGGSFGVVYDAFDSKTGQDAAIKVLRPDFIDDSDACARFEDEAAVAASIDHPTGLPVYGIGRTEDGSLYYVMKKVRGKTLEKLLNERGKNVADQQWLFRLLRIFHHVCEGVSAAHRRGVIHRDLKPENIVVSDEDFVTVIDWGLAKQFSPTNASGPDSRTMAGMVMGTPGYMSPEQARGDSAATDPRSDVFSLGIILYRILTADQPFEGETARESILRAIYREPLDPRRLNPWMSRRIAAVCKKAIEKDPKKRYSDAHEFAQDLHAFLEDRNVSVARLSHRERLRGWARRRPGRALLTTAAATLLFFAVILVAGQVWLDENLANKSFKNIARLDMENDSIERRLQALAGKGETSSPSSDAARHEQQMLRIRYLMNSHEILVTLENIVKLRYIRTSPETTAALKSRFFSSVRRALDMAEPEVAKTLILMAREDLQTWTGLLRFSPEETERLDVLEKEADTLVLEDSRQNKS